MQVPVEVLKKIPLFQEISEEFLGEVAGRCEEQVFQPRDLVFREGQRGDRLYMILAGTVRITKNIEGIGEEQLALLKEGAYFGEMALVDEAPRSADARAAVETRLAVMRKADLEELMFANRELASEILWNFVRTLSRRLRETNEKLRAAYQMSLF